MHLGSSTYVLPSNYLKQASAHGCRETFLETKLKVRANTILPRIMHHSINLLKGDAKAIPLLLEEQDLYPYL